MLQNRNGMVVKRGRQLPKVPKNERERDALAGQSRVETGATNLQLPHPVVDASVSGSSHRGPAREHGCFH